MKIQRPKFSQNINADIAVGVIDRNIRALTGVEAPVYTSFDFSGVHERTAKGDALSVNISSTSKRNAIRYQLKRDSLYHILPEYLFHPLDRYADTDGDKEVFLEKRLHRRKLRQRQKSISIHTTRYSIICASDSSITLTTRFLTMKLLLLTSLLRTKMSTKRTLLSRHVFHM